MTDPNWTLIEARNAVGDYRNAVTVSEVERAAQKLADHFEALDEWLTKGGFLPADWLPAIDRNKPRTLGNLAAGLPLRVQGEEPEALDDENLRTWREAQEIVEGEADILRKIDEARTHPERRLPRPKREKE